MDYWKRNWFQGYTTFARVYLKNARTFESMKKTIEKAHWESAKGKPDQNYNNCSKAILS